MIVVRAAAFATIFVAAAAAPPLTWPRMAAYTEQYIAAEVGRFVSGDLSTTSIRDMAAAAWALVNERPGQPPPSAANITTAVGMLDLVFSRQLPSGQWPWTWNSATCTDTNAVQFTALPALLVAVHAAPLLPSGWLAGKIRQFTLAATASFAEGDGPDTEAQPYYTNIATMRLVVLTLAAQVTGNVTIGDNAAAARADWFARIDGAGVHEFSSPTYTAVTLHNLHAGAGAVTDTAVAAQLRRYAGFLLAHAAAAAWQPARAAMGGAHSRDYDFVFGDAGMTWAYLLTGLAGVTPGDDTAAGYEDPITMAELYIAWTRGDLLPAPAATRSLAATPPVGGWRAVRASWAPAVGPSPATAGTDAYFFASAAATLGTSSLYYGGQDKQLVAQLPLCTAAGCAAPAVGLRLAQISLVQDRFDAPYGQNRGGNSGADVGKPTHLKATVAAVQDFGLALSLQDLTMAIEATSRPLPFSSIAANVVFPAGAGVDAVYVDGVRLRNVSADAPPVDVAVGATVAVRSGGGVAAFRVPFVDGLAGYVPTARILFDGPPGRDAARLATYLYRGPNVTFAANPPPSRSIVIAAVGAAADDAAAVAFSAALAGLALTNDAANASNWRVRLGPGPSPAPYAGFGSTLEASLCVPFYKQILHRAVNGSVVTPPAPGSLAVAWADGRTVALTSADF